MTTARTPTHMGSEGDDTPSVHALRHMYDQLMEAHTKLHREIRVLIARMLDSGLGNQFEKVCRRDAQLTYMLIFYHDVTSGGGPRDANLPLKDEDEEDEKRDLKRKKMEAESSPDPFITPNAEEKNTTRNKRRYTRIPTFRNLDADCEMEELPHVIIVE